MENMKVLKSSVIEKGDLFIGDMLYIDSDNLNGCLAFLIENNIKNVVLNSYHNYHLKDLSFLKEFGKYITGITIASPIDDISELKNNLHLETLFIYHNINQELDLSSFPNLKHGCFILKDNLKNLDKCYQLEHLTIANYPKKDLTYLKNLTQLKYLKLTHSKKIECIEGIEFLTELSKIELLYLSKLYNVSKMYVLKKLSYLFIIKCKKIHKKEIDNFIHLPFFAFNGKRYSPPLP